MDKMPANGRKSHFLIIATTTPKLLVGEGGKHALVISNESSGVVRIGLSGSSGMALPASTIFADNYTRDEYWVWTSSSSGTVSGFVVS